MRGDVVKGHLDLLLLAALAPAPAHGYAVIERLRERSAGAFDFPRGRSTGAPRLERAGLVRSAWADDAPRRRRVYELTRRGRTALAERETSWRRFAARSTSWSGARDRADPTYLAGARAALPRGLPRERILSEAEAHLRDAAAEVGEAEAVARFGAAREVASRFAEPAARRALRIVALAPAALLAVALVPGYGIVENALPPAPWAEGGMPDHLLWKRNAVWLLLVLAVPPRLPRSRSCGARLARAGRRGGGAPPAGGGCGTGAVLAVNWWDDVPGTPWWIAAVPVGELLLAVAVAPQLARAVVLARAL